MRNSLAKSVLCAGFVWLGLCSAAWALPEGFTDKQDGQLDLSDWLIERKGFLPIPIVITEPAVGYGGGVALMFLGNSMAESAQKAKETGLNIPPDIWVFGAAATENGTKAAFAGGMKSFDDGRYKYRGGIGKVDVNLAYYGIGGASSGAHGIDYSLDGWMSSQQVLGRLGKSDNWLGLRWIYMSLTNKLDISGNPLANLQPNDATRKASGIGLTLEHDSRDNIFTPTSGWTGALDATFYDPDWGSATTFQSYRGHVFSYWPVSKTVVVAGRLDGRSARGRVPFYMLPFIDMRGIPAARYQDQNTAVVETEVRWDVTPRWAAIGFIGAGRAWGRNTQFGDVGSAVSKGVGARYLIARKLGLWVGVDYAHGPEGNTGYIQVGSAWR
jgi:hypothetical protein